MNRPAPQQPVQRGAPEESDLTCAQDIGDWLAAHLERVEAWDAVFTRTRVTYQGAYLSLDTRFLLFVMNQVTAGFLACSRAAHIRSG